MGTDPVREENPSGLTRSRILLQYTWGPGTARYVNDLVGQGLDGQVNPITGDFDLVNSSGWNASYENWFNANWLSNFTYSEAHAVNNAGQLGTTYDGQISGRQPVVDSDATNVVRDRVHVGSARESGR